MKQSLMIAKVVRIDLKIIANTWDLPRASGFPDSLAIHADFDLGSSLFNMVDTR